ncbi:hypothetical protein NE237_028817 [Protea cynaroides]|uniref:Uncharacterized protein n=1 Tax=Protea cynaroides TaxID=273540 RepID=A0A9Q0GT53_9MAGN|nr:hypothetical protein NE237_028817 [Protea cynaroides]
MVAQSMPDSTLLSQGAIGVVGTSGRLLRPTCGALTVKRKPEFQGMATEAPEVLNGIGISLGVSLPLLQWGYGAVSFDPRGPIVADPRCTLVWSCSFALKPRTALRLAAGRAPRAGVARHTQSFSNTAGKGGGWGRFGTQTLKLRATSRVRAELVCFKPYRFERLRFSAPQFFNGLFLSFSTSLETPRNCTRHFNRYKPPEQI